MRNAETEAFPPVSPKDVLLIQCRFDEMLDEVRNSSENNGNGQFCDDEDDILRKLALEFPLRVFVEWQNCQRAIAEYKRLYPEEWESFVKNNGSGNNHQGKNKE